MARKTADVRQIITLQCGDCRERHHTTVKNLRNASHRVELRTYCPRGRSPKSLCDSRLHQLAQAATRCYSIPAPP